MSEYTQCLTFTGIFFGLVVLIFGWGLIEPEVGILPCNVSKANQTGRLRKLLGYFRICLHNWEYPGMGRTCKVCKQQQKHYIYDGWTNI